MLPVVALVGRPNVGKSTLFNRLTHTRDALVADFPGLTRDRQYGQASYEQRQFIVVDTGGITGDEEGIDARMAAQSLQAIEEADVVFFLVDARAGFLPADQMIADHLRKTDKQVFVLANKVDGIDGDSESAEFYSMGLGDIHQIAAAHGRGVAKLIQDALEPLDEEFPEMAVRKDEEKSELDPEEQLEQLQNLPIKLAIVGKPNVGKSTLTNRILGEDRVVVYDMPGTTRDSVHIPLTRDEREYVLIDTAGVRKRKKVSEAVEKFSIVKTLKAIEEANVVLLVIDAREGIADQDLSLLGYVLNSGRSLVIAVNKWDGLDTDVKDDIKRELDRRLGFVDFARLHFISALHGTGVGNLFESVNEAYRSATKRINTSMLTQIMEMAQDDHQPPLVRGRRVKMKYAHAGGYNPPVIVIHGNQVDDLPSSYKRYLMNYFRKALDVMGTPIKIEFREGANPFEGKKNQLTLAQQRKRKRLMAYHKQKK
ncbi:MULTISPECIES: ribosome biogenesis GTPase Der [Marisediminitalea]|jgi:GTP-binding protein|uniref:ribosome biogenesis GTPase Der n=1 Tax=Marisediminitalea TaxID=2662254 RepID=UPI0020CC4BB0|nr:ribosome biogenesis GTPase Der [Marisediminitalea aggregata]MCP3862420.1 ribosome biogenesis GTPase Der [Aestuariibacter sp.]MCP4236026.1 ribosome biogenesis GTPase Der [Aestuariibacter sp.]MCP4525763.1 ribosome biogenesis GTPase Der [Aestuariibacter sp.]MCP4947358.1 ribosome biogenesis GTPase Der [Aestuariibacter sp.]MCP5010358.1 ribosome biogenesis GTPase Der [Aestuariibacter sp.]|tara:strand:- start:6788 stop:8233 length:1446 start_codon:yes stop_codon:yes gene_type:complete